MSRTFLRAAGAIPGKLVSRMTLIAVADDTERFSRRMRRILAQRVANSKRMSGGFLCKTFCHRFAANRKKERKLFRSLHTRIVGSFRPQSRRVFSSPAFLHLPSERRRFSKRPVPAWSRRKE